MIDHTCNKNLIMIYSDRGGKVPFKARRWTWAPTATMIVTEVTIKKYPYGDALGYMDRGNPSPEIKPITCAGCFQWREVE